MDGRTVVARSGSTPPSCTEATLSSTLAPPAPAAASDPAPAPTDPKRRRTLVGFVGTRRIVEIILTVVLGVGGCLLLFGANFGLDMVHDQLDAQAISFPAKGSPALTPKEFPGLQQYAGQKVDSGPKAKAYANEFINVHLQSIAGGKTYSQVSAASQADPTNAKLTGQVAALFKGETLRGLLLYAWGWSVVSSIALYAGIAALLGFVIMLLATIGDFIADPRIAAHHIAT
jgi:hypothetical protein